MTTKIKILQGASTEKFICDSDILKEWCPIYELQFIKGIEWNTIFMFFRWIEKQGIDVKMEYIPYKKLVICL